MSLIQEFAYQAKALENADFQVVGGRLAALLDWMESQAEIKQVLNKLRETGRGKQLISTASRQRPVQACTNEEIAMVGLEIMEQCRDSKAELFRVALGLGCEEYGVNSIGAHSDKAIRSYIKPFLNYVLRQLPAEESASGVVQVAPQALPVAIQESLQHFRKDYPDPKKVCFIMMRFGDTSAHQAIEQAIKEALNKYGFTGMLARDKEYHEDLYPNIQTYMHGCGFGIAVFERIESDDFNPNVSLEVGYLLGLKKLVLLLKDKTLETLHTDLVGKLYRSFDPLHPEQTIASQVEQWLEDKGLI